MRMACFNSFPQNRFVISTLFSSSNILNLAMDKMLVSISNKTSEYGLVFFDLTLMSYFDLIVYHGLIRFPQTIFFFVSLRVRERREVFQWFGLQRLSLTLQRNRQRTKCNTKGYPSVLMALGKISKLKRKTF